MNENNKKVLVIGSGVAGLSAAVKLSRLGIDVEIIEKAHRPGGYAGQFACKAVDKCEKCGACIVEEKIKYVESNPRIRVHTGAHLNDLTRSNRFSAKIVDENVSEFLLNADAVIIATGFKPFDPVSKPYGYGLFKNVITNLDLEKMLRQQSTIRKPSDNNIPQKIAFIQCVGSRDSKLNHLWCSKICCGAALRMARLIKSRQPGIDITFFYMDIQTFGKDFENFLSKAEQDITMIRSIPGDIYKTRDDQLKVSYYKAGEKETTDDIFDIIILSVGITPGKDNQNLAGMLNIPLDGSGFFRDLITEDKNNNAGLFFAGTTKGPMTIADAVADADRAVWEVATYFNVS